MSQRLSVRRYPEQHYTTLFNPDTGFFARIEDKGYSEPKWSAHGPELLDVAITNWCDRGCGICYRSSSNVGAHMALSDYERLVKQASQIGVAQIAIGGGNPNQHPDFGSILRITRWEFGIVPSYTTNGRGLSSSVMDASARYCGAVAVSAYSPYDEMIDAVRNLQSSGIRTNLHFVLDSRSVKIAVSWLRDPPTFLAGINAIVFLNYKPIGRMSDGVLLRESEHLPEFFRLVGKGGYGFRIGFDSCMTSGVVSYLPSISASLYDGCEAGRFSMFISESMTMYPCSFMEPLHVGIPLTEDNMLETWRSADLFVDTREKLQETRCPTCSHGGVCLGGCPAFEEIDLCDAACQ